MITVFRAHGLRVMIFVDDHEPAHVHVFGDEQAKIDLVPGCGPPTLVWADGMTRGDIRRAMAIIIEQREMLLTKWREIHG